ncbi:Cyclic nucleotide-gated cation channel subunit A [Diplonema papillatum]|nr:Cyclic nucleotide-gated cation channel subunit A [Diplonema papillatum]
MPTAFELREAGDELLTKPEREARLLGLNQGQLRRYQRLFRVFDRDRDGSIDTEELMLLLKTLGIAATKETARGMIANKDGDNSGHVEYEEFIEILLDHGGADQNWSQLLDKMGDDDIKPEMLRRSEEARAHVKTALKLTGTTSHSGLRPALDFCVSIAFCYMYILILLEDVGKADVGYEAWWKIVGDVGCSVFFVFDMALMATSNEPFMPHAQAFDRSSSLRRYAQRPGFCADAVSVLPYDAVFLPLSPGLSQVVRHARLFKIVCLPRLFRVENTGFMSPSFVTFYFQLVPVFMNVVRSILVLHTFAVIWILLKGEDYSYIDALYFILYTLTTVGYGDIVVDGAQEKIFACFLLIVGACINGLTVGYLTAFIMRSDIDGDKVDKMRQTLAVLRHSKVPHMLQEEILSYQYHVLQHNLGVAYTDVIAGLPPAMQEQVSLYMRVRLVTQVPMFAVCELAIQIALAQSLKNVVVPPEEYIMVAGEEGHEMFFLSHGFSDVLSKEGKMLATITKGGFFGEVALLVETQRHTNVKALTFCDLFILQRAEFNLILDRYPSFASHIHREIERQAEPGEGDKQPVIQSETEALWASRYENEGGNAAPRRHSHAGIPSPLSVSAAPKKSQQHSPSTAGGGSGFAVMGVIHKLKSKASKTRLKRSIVSASHAAPSPPASPRLLLPGSVNKDTAVQAMDDFEDNCEGSNPRPPTVVVSDVEQKDTEWATKTTANTLRRMFALSRPSAVQPPHSPTSAYSHFQPLKQHAAPNADLIHRVRDIGDAQAKLAATLKTMMGAIEEIRATVSTSAEVSESRFAKLSGDFSRIHRAVSSFSQNGGCQPTSPAASANGSLNTLDHHLMKNVR